MGSSNFVLFFVVFVLFVVVAIIILQIPILVAKSRGIVGNNLKTIKILSWCGIFAGITWVIALVLSLVWRSDETFIWDGVASDMTQNENQDNTNFAPDKLEKLFELKQKGALTDEEYEVQKRKFLE
jgi:energy-coupling factor transporter transmembrane protein EcfT